MEDELKSLGNDNTSRGFLKGRAVSVLLELRK
jgi:hypothetical protein